MDCTFKSRLKSGECYEAIESRDIGFVREQARIPIPREACPSPKPDPAR
jgi:hypothetical protein